MLRKRSLNREAIFLIILDYFAMRDLDSQYFDPTLGEMTDKETSESKSDGQTNGQPNAHEDCCGGHCENDVNLESPTNPEEAAFNDALEEVTHATSQEIDWKTQAAYLAAEVENMQKRFSREASDIRKYANEDILKKIVPVLDTLSLALSAASKAKAQGDKETLSSNKVFLSFIQGVEMTAKQFEQVLQHSGVEFIEAVGKPFDPFVHEALGQNKVEGVEDSVITEEFQRGFKLGGRVIRPAKVLVNKN